jgi:hypothetical protein
MSHAGIRERGQRQEAAPMPASKYKVYGVGQPVGQGASNSFHVGVAAIGKKAEPNQPNVVINELFCSTLARCLFLPCPPGVLLENNGETYFCSLNFNLAGQSLPPAPVADVVALHPETCWGITLFDVLVMNPDRHPGNLSFNRQTGDIQIFDHSHAFLQVNGTPDQVMAAMNGQLAIGGHCIKGELRTWTGFDVWTARIKAVPDYVVDATFDAIGRVGFPADKKAPMSHFIKQRRDNIDVLVTSNLGQFPKLPARP